MKRILSLLLILILPLSLAACGDGGTPSEGPTDSAASVSSEPSADKDSGTTSDTQAVRVIPNQRPTEETNLAIACEQAKSRVVVYNMDAYNGKNLDAATVWSFTPNSSGSSNMSGVKYRSDSVFGDVVVMCASGGYASIVTYPKKKVIWSVSSSGNNPHSIELLPGGNVVVASSTGATVRLYHTSALVENPNASVTKGIDYSLVGAHGVLWDPKYDCLWALGDGYLDCYTLSGEGTSMVLVKDESRSKRLPSGNGHDLSADFTDSDYLWISEGTQVVRYNKAKGEFEKNYENKILLNRPAVKGIGNNRNGHFVYCYPSTDPVTSMADWCTDTIYYVYYNEEGQVRWKACRSTRSAYYKVVSFYGEYQ